MLFRSRINYIIRNINIAVYMIILYFLFLLGQVVMKEKINIYSDLAIYQKEEMMVLIETTMILFSLWVVILCIYKVIRLCIDRQNKNKTKEDFKEVSNQVNDEILIDGFTKEEYKLLSNYLKEIKTKQKERV